MNLMQIPLQNFVDEKIIVGTVFKIRRGYKKLLRKSDLNSILSAQNYIKLYRNDENLSI